MGNLSISEKQGGESSVTIPKIDYREENVRNKSVGFKTIRYLWKITFYVAMQSANSGLGWEVPRCVVSYGPGTMPL